MGKIVRMRHRHQPTQRVFRSKYDAQLSERPLEDYGLPNSVFFMVILGRPGSGKTNVGVNLLANEDELYHQVFQKVFLMGPSQHTLPSCGLDHLPESQRFDQLSVDNLWDVLETARQQQGACLLVLDDVGSDLKAGGRPLELALQKTIVNRRHVCPGGLSIMMMAQSLMQIPLTLRKMLTMLIVCGLPLEKERDTIYEEIVQGAVSKQTFNEVMRTANREPYQWISIWPGKPPEEMFFHKFDPLVVREDPDDRPL